MLERSPGQPRERQRVHGCWLVFTNWVALTTRAGRCASGGGRFLQHPPPIAARQCPSCANVVRFRVRGLVPK